MDVPAAIRARQLQQDGVISRRQVLALGGDDLLIRRMSRRHLWNRLLTGVYVDHTGEPSWSQRCWAALAFYEPAALAGASALRWAGLRTGTASAEVDVAIDHTRRVSRQRGVHVTRVVRLEDVTHPSRRPPVVRLDHALLSCASRSRTDAEAIAVLGDACQLRHTTARRLLTALGGLPNITRRQLLHEVLADVESGAFSALERRYLRAVERAHGLPTAERQRLSRAGPRPAYRDVEYHRWGVAVELDGHLGHDLTADRWADLERDVDAAVAGILSVRIGWRQTLEPCRTAAAVGRILQARGWTGSASFVWPGVHGEPGQRQRHGPQPGLPEAREILGRID